MTQPLNEIHALKTFLGSIFGKPTKKTVSFQEVSSSSIEKQAKEIISKVFAGADIKTKKTERKRTADSLILRYHVTIGGGKYVIKAAILLESRFMNLSIWSHDQEKLLDILAVGDLKAKFRLRAMASVRLKPWVKGKK